MATDYLSDRKQFLRTLFLCAATTLFAACASTQDSEAFGVMALPLEGASSDSAARGENRVASPRGAYFVDVKANGTGCPAGSWNVDVAEDGKSFDAVFSAYEAEVDASTSISVKDCQLAIKLHSPDGLMFAVRRLVFEGYAYLERGVNLAMSTNYYFQGNPVVPTTSRTDITGPYDDKYVVIDKVDAGDVPWSPCGVDRDLNITTRLRLRNSNPRGYGFANLTEVLHVELDWRTCR